MSGLFLLAGACTATLDAGHNNAPDACATSEVGLSGCVPTGLLDNLVGHWRLDDGAGSMFAYDSSGRGNEGVLHSLDVNSAWVDGHAQGALELAQAGWVQVPRSASIDSITDRITISAWVYLEGTIGPDCCATVLSRQTGTSIQQHYYLSLYMEGQPTLFLETTAGYAVLRPANLVPKGEWTHLAGVYDGSAARLYVNGLEVYRDDALTGKFAPDTTPVILGGNGNDASGIPNELIPGRIDELMLYARDLSAAEIGQLAAGRLFPGTSRAAGLD